MGIEFKASICPSCGAKLQFPEEAERIECPYCGVSVFIDRHELRVRIIGKPINLALFEKMEEELLKKLVSNDKREVVYSIDGLARLMADCNNKVFPCPKSEVKRFVEWVNGRCFGKLRVKEERKFILGRWVTLVRFSLMTEGGL